MESNIFWIYAFNIIVNSALSFFTTIMLIELFMFLFRIKEPRVKALCLVIPFCKIIVDLALYNFSSWALWHGMNPLIAQGYRQLSIMIDPFTGIQLSIQGEKTFSIADLIALSVHPLWIKIIVSVMACGSLMATFRYLARIFYEKKRIEILSQNSNPISFPNLNESIASSVKKRKITLSVSKEISSPCISGKMILFPHHLIDDLSQEEIDAIIAHEMTHYFWKDSYLRLAYSFVGALFWWLPSKWCERRIEEMQEQASDSAIHRFGISRLALAGALLKTAQKTKEKPSVLLFSFVWRSSTLKRRMAKILQEPMSETRGWKALRYGLLICSLISILLGSLWIF